LAKIRFVFDKSLTGKILLDNIGFRKLYTQIEQNEITILESER
jgi:hypothetical protein